LYVDVLYLCLCNTAVIYVSCLL